MSGQDDRADDPERALVRDAMGMRWVALPAMARDHAVMLVLDTLAVGLGAVGRDHGVADALAGTSAADGPATLWLDGRGAEAAQTALVNGTLAEVLDFQEVWLDGRNNGHAAVVVLPALLALAEEAGARGRPVSGARLLTAFAAALCVNVRLLRALGRAHRAEGRGVRTTALGAPIAAALGGAVLLGLGENACLAAANHAAGALPLGLLAAMAPSEGAYSQDKDVAVGLSARHAVLSVQLARAGVSAAPRAISGARGLLATLGFESGRPLDAIPFPEIDLLAYAMKPYPSNYGTQAAIRAALDCAAAVSHGSLARVTVRVKASSAASLANRAITGPLSARFSLPFAVASGLVRGRCRLEDFEGEALHDASVLAMMERVEIVGDDALEAMNAAHGLFPARLRAVAEDGTTYEHAHDDVWDGLDAAARAGVVRDKAYALLGRGDAGESDGATALLAAIDGLEAAPSLDALTRAVARSVRAPAS